MKPLSLKLQGFKGIFFAFGRDEISLDLRTIPDAAALVAFIGPNGAGKTTILENLHPYRLMPSKSSTLTPGGFSYWNEIQSTTGLKELDWEHGGVSYRTVLNFRVTGKTNKADCYLYQADRTSGVWTPVALPDGTLSDGKADTYDRCVDWILGPPERFFTAHFSSQKRKTIAEYDVRDIKSILASVLNLDDYRSLSSKASLVAKAIKQHFDSLNAELEDARRHDVEVALANSELERIAGQLQLAEADVQAGVVIVERARNELSVREAKRDAQARDIEERSFLTAQISSAKSKATVRTQQIQAEFETRVSALTVEIGVCINDQTRTRAAIAETQRELARLRAILAQRADIDGAAAILVQSSEELADVDAAIEQCRALLATATADRTTAQQLIAQKATLQTQGVAGKDALDTLHATAALINEVPCGGTGLQGQCKLLVNAREAAAAIPGKAAKLAETRTAHEEVKAKIVTIQAKLGEYVAAETRLDELQSKRKAIVTRTAAATATAAKRPLLEEAERRLPGVETTLADLEGVLKAAATRQASLQEQQQQMGTQCGEALQAVAAALASEVKEYQDRLDKLAEPVTEAQITEARGWVSNANDGLQQYRSRVVALIEQKTAMVGKLEAARALASRSAHIRQMAERCAVEIGYWKRLEKGLGNDGCVALCIDDAGPEIAVICNSLLKQCFGGRFVVRLDTQVEQKSGSVKETFDVTVFDSVRGGKGKLLRDMSGGEEVLVNECLTRALALYSARSSKQCYQTLFTDETDGALDPQAKRTFMEMKRAVLAEGGYVREYFITHTPELWALADHTVDVTRL